MLIEYERAIDSDVDVVEMNKRIFFPYGAPFFQLYKGSPNPLQQEIASRVTKVLLMMNVCYLYGIF